MSNFKHPDSDVNFCTYVLMDTRKPGPFSYGRYSFPYEPFYVGKGRPGRYKAHVSTAIKTVASTHKLNKIRKILASGNRVMCRVVKRDINERKAFALEARLVSVIGRFDLGQGPLTNKSDGGEGNGGAAWSEQAKAKNRARIEAITDEEKRKYRRKVKRTWRNKSQEEIDARSEKTRATNSNKAPALKELALQKHRQSMASRPEEAKAKTRRRKQRTWAEKTEAELLEIKRKRRAAISDEYQREINRKIAQKRASKSEEELEAIRVRRSKAVKANWRKRRRQYGENGRRS